MSDRIAPQQRFALSQRNRSTPLAHSRRAQEFHKKSALDTPFRVRANTDKGLANVLKGLGASTEAAPKFRPLLIRMQRMHPAKFPAILELHPLHSRTLMQSRNAMGC